MEKSQKVGAQVYGYAVCIVAVITFLISVTTLVNAVIDLQDPIHGGWFPQGPSLASFENYKMDILKTSEKGDESVKASYIPDDQTLHAMYEAARADRIQSAKHQSNKSIMVGSLLIFISVILFATHWRWVRGLNKLVVT
jgi:hypothetical protein